MCTGVWVYIYRCGIYVYIGERVYVPCFCFSDALYIIGVIDEQSLLISYTGNFSVCIHITIDGKMYYLFASEFDPCKCH